MTRVALITGSYKGMGFETARQLLAKNMTVYISARTLEKAQSAVDQLADAGEQAKAISLDVTSDDSVQSAISKIQTESGKLDVLINNAGINPEFAAGSTPTTLEADMLGNILEANVVDSFRMIQAATPLLSKGDDARIVNVSSSLGSLTTIQDPESMYFPFNLPAYNTSKTALNALTVAYAKALADQDIAVVSVCPGWVQSDMGGEHAAQTIDEGVRIIVDLATRQGPETGIFVDEDGLIPW